MRVIFFAVLAACLMIGGEWAYRTFLRPLDPLAPEVVALAEHFKQDGISVRPYAVRHGYRHSKVLAAAALEIIRFPLPVAVELCPTEGSAEEHLQAILRSPNLMHPRRNGRLVMYLPMWGDDTGAMAVKVENSFSLFKHRT